MKNIKEFMILYVRFIIVNIGSMVLIFSENNEPTTQKVIDWLIYQGKSWLRINETDTIVISEIVLSDTAEEPTIILSVNNKNIDFGKITKYWYRRGGLNIYPRLNFTFDDKQMEHSVRKYLMAEYKSIADFIYWYLKHFKQSLGGFEEAENKKLHYLLLARKAGLSIPHTLVTSNSDKLTPHFSDKVISKSIFESFPLSGKNARSIASTIEIPIPLNILDDEKRFSPTLFQNMLDKRLEIRIFFINQSLYPMAIFSQENEKTKLDFRNYDNTRPNRNVPFTLPNNITQKISKFIKLSKLNTGSIDMVLTQNNEYVFLEVNPVGQFGQVSLPCNYSLYKKVAQFFGN